MGWSFVQGPVPLWQLKQFEQAAREDPGVLFGSTWVFSSIDWKIGGTEVPGDPGGY